ncbi:MAG: GntR family transcriptional regulator [Desulfovibrionaceae bacterium]
MRKERIIVDRLSEIISDLGLQPGDRLPAERNLAPDLGVSRNTLRNILRMLEARGLVNIRKGSGTYLRTRFMGAAIEPLEQRHNPHKLIVDRFEAAYLLLPLVAEQSALRIGERQLADLQKCNVALSRGLFSEESEKVWSESLSFFRLLGMGTGNEFIVRTVEQVCTIDISADELVVKLSRREREKLFAYHVKILHALRVRDAEEAAWLTQDYLLHLAKYIEEHEQVRMSDLVFRAIREREGEWEGS